MQTTSRRDFLQAAASTAAALLFGPLLRGAPASAPASDERYITCFYQFENGDVAKFAGPGALPDGAQFLHIFSQSSPGMKPHPDRARAVHACGNSFKFAQALDVHKYKNWAQADEKQLREWAKQFRGECLDSPAPADYWAFNEMPTTGFSKGSVQSRAADWCRLIHDPGDGAKFPGVFYFTEQNVADDHWTSLSDDFWAAVDQASILVVGEHYHSWDYCFTDQLNQNHLFGVAKFLADSGKSPQTSIAQDKYAVLHSSYYGPKDTGWHGPLNNQKNLEDLEAYFQHVIDVTRASRFGKSRIGFGPLAAKDLDERMIPILAKVLGKDAAKFK